MAYSQMLETMWFGWFGGTSTPNFIGVLAILALFAYLCFKKKLGLSETFIVIFPVVMAYTLSGYLPQYLSGLVIIGIGFLWGFALSKVIPNMDGAAKAYVIILCASAALGFFGYVGCEYNYGTDGAAFNITSEASTVQNSNNEVGWFSSLMEIVKKLANFLLGNGITGFFRCAFPPSLASIGDFLSYPIQIVMSILFLQVLALVIPIFGNWKAAFMVGVGVGILSYIGVI